MKEPKRPKGKVLYEGETKERKPRKARLGKLNEILDRVAMLIVTAVVITALLLIVGGMAYITISLMGLPVFLFLCVVIWAFWRVMPDLSNSNAGCPY